MTDNLNHNLALALSKLKDRFGSDAETMHLAASIVLSSLFNKNGISCVIVGGQSAAYWMRIPSSTDIDFVSDKMELIENVLHACGFSKDTNFPFRFKHNDTNILIEIVGEKITHSPIHPFTHLPIYQRHETRSRNETHRY